jgi:hypothetical protein
MNTSPFLLISLGCIGTVAAIVGATPVLAQGDQHIPASGYCTGATVQISGWETDLVRRNKGLEKFHWSAINTVQHYTVMQTPTAQRPAAKPLSPYHNVKPRVVSTWASTKGPVVDRTCIATIDHANVSAHLRSANASASGQMRSYETSPNGYQQAQYGGERSTEDRVTGRLTHY